MNIGTCWRAALRLAAAAVFGVAVLQSAGQARADAGFERWVASFRSTAAQNGISGATFDRAFARYAFREAEYKDTMAVDKEFKGLLDDGTLALIDTDKMGAEEGGVIDTSGPVRR